jgi:hypothetical protein
LFDVARCELRRSNCDYWAGTTVGRVMEFRTQSADSVCTNVRMAAYAVGICACDDEEELGSTTELHKQTYGLSLRCGSEVNSRTSPPRGSSTRYLLRADWRLQNTLLAPCMICISSPNMKSSVPGRSGACLLLDGPHNRTSRRPGHMATDEGGHQNPNPQRHCEEVSCRA